MSIMDAFDRLERQAQQGAADLTASVEDAVNRSYDAGYSIGSGARQTAGNAVTTIQTDARGALDSVTRPLRELGRTASNAARTATDTLKWILIGMFVIAVLAILAWFAWLYLQGRVALAIIPKVAEGAGAAASGAAG